MGAFNPDPAPHSIHTVHRVGAGGLGAFLVAFGTGGLALAPAFMSNTGPVVMGLSTNGLLSTLSLVVGVVLIGAAVRGGRTASTAAVVVGCLFLFSGLGNVLVLDTPLNMLAFRMTNVVFSLLVGAALLFLGAYGRFTGGLPATSPYAGADAVTGRPPTRTDGVIEAAMAAAERAVAQHSATPEQVARVAAAAAHRTHEDRRRAFTAAS